MSQETTWTQVIVRKILVQNEFECNIFSRDEIGAISFYKPFKTQLDRFQTIKVKSNVQLTNAIVKNSEKTQ